MSPDRWREITELFEATLPVPARERSAFLDRTCGNADLRDEVERLLHSDGAAELDGFLAPTESGGSSECSVPFIGATVSARQWVGPYEVNELLGVGGMSCLYRAVRHEPFQQVALKVVGGSGMRLLLPLLENERQILSDLKHPFIVRLLDSGTVDGQPFLVLEHIDGLPIDCFCTERNLQLEARLALFLKVCAAVQYAHQRGVLHCDLKPTNVLVTDDICPIVIDFGVARRLGCKGTNDPPGAVFGTPAYMSPEQASGRTDTLGPEADVYALGALLYKLLTGQPPFQGSSMLKTLDLVSTRSPIPPRHLHPLLPRDVDAISLKCLEKKPDDRYPTVAELAADLESFLAGRRTLEGMGQHQHGEQK